MDASRGKEQSNFNRVITCANKERNNTSVAAEAIVVIYDPIELHGELCVLQSSLQPVAAATTLLV